MIIAIQSSSGDKSYECRKYDDGSWSCQCPHWLYRLSKSKTACKHIDEAKKLEKELDQIPFSIDWSEPVEEYAI